MTTGAGKSPSAAARTDDESRSSSPTCSTAGCGTSAAREIVPRRADKWPAPRTITLRPRRRAGRQLISLREASLASAATASPPLAWNHARHPGLYLGVPAMGAVLHTAKPPPAPDGDRVHRAPRARQRWWWSRRCCPAAVRSSCGMSRPSSVVVMRDRRAFCRRTPRPDYGLLMLPKNVAGRRRRTTLDENQSYTSGHHGQPKGVVAGHRPALLHPGGLNDALGISDRRHPCRWFRCFTPTPGACPTAPR